MNILYLTNHLNIGGISSYVLTLASGLHKNGHKVYLSSSGGQLLPKIIGEGIIFSRIPIKTKSEISPKVLISLGILLNYVREEEIDIIHANTRVTQVLACLIRKFSGVPFVSTCHGFFKKRLSRRIFPGWGEEVIAISAEVKEHLTADFGLKEENVRIINNGIDTVKFSPVSEDRAAGCKKKLGLGDGLVVGIIARLSDVKGHVYLIEAMRIVLERYPDVRLLIAGEGRMKDKLVDLSRKMAIEEKVFFLPNIMDTKDVLPAIDIFVLPSLKEGLGLSLMEAMAMEKAVIGSNVGGIKSLIRDGVCGLMVEPGDHKQLAGAITELLGDFRKRESFGKNARIFIAENFSQEKMVSETERLYLRCLGVE